MPTTRSLLAGSLLVASSVALPAQRTWIVDDDGGPGVDFTDVPPAVRAAADGDTVVVRAGNYSATRIDKGISVRSELFPPRVPEIEIADLRSDQTAVVRGVWGNAIAMRNNAGIVHLQSSVFAFQRSTIDNCRLITADNCQLAQLTCRGSTVVLTTCVVEALEAGEPGLRSINSTAHVIATRATGGEDTCGAAASPPGPGIDLRGGRLILTGDDNAVSAGAENCAHDDTVAIATDGGTIQLDPVTTLTPNVIGGSGTVVRGFVPSVVRRANIIGATQLDLRGEPGAAYAIVASPPMFDIPTPFGALWISPAHLCLQAGTVGPTGTERYTVDPGHIRSGSAVTFQAMFLPNSGPLALSEPSVIVFN